MLLFLEENIYQCLDNLIYCHFENSFNLCLVVFYFCKIG
jgi:hypothetical protein